jgi:isoleucyl-tRNA synthetase
MYDHKKVEKEIADFWKAEGIMAKAMKKNADGPKFYFADGPPYATGQIHPGTGWNKTLKDAVCRYWRMRGCEVRAQAGYDTHGLPIEVKVEQELKIGHKYEIEKYGIDKFTAKCKQFATKYMGVMGSQFLSLGVWMDFENPYVTYKDPFIESSWLTLQEAWKKGLLTEGVYVLPYCFRCETTMANYELEYGDETDPSLYVKFLSNDKPGEYLVIWTTTPWTLVANMAVMAHPTLTYVRVKVENETWILAKDLLDKVMGIAGKSATVVEEFSGRKLKDYKYLHPFQGRIKKEYVRKVVLSDEYVTVEDGTGLVHCAPGHGPEDFIIGKRYDIEPFCPVDTHGNYTGEAGELAGKNVRAANPLVIRILADEGMLLAEERVKHRYPHCWRCKTPLIFLSTRQWFITISKMKEAMLDQIDKTEWHPDFAKERFKEFVEGAPDWCISRQRYWGIPLPIWRCAKPGCDEITVIGSRKELQAEVKELHRPYIDEVRLKCKCGGEMARVPDVLDVWFDSGNAVWAALDEAERKKYGERADLIIEGQDQIRGWFYSLLGSGMIRYGSCPYKRVLMHGFFVDEKGEKMSKSVGNFTPLEQILEKYGADSFRLWGISNTVWDELKFSWDDMKKASTDLNIALNVVLFLERFHPAKRPGKPKELGHEDAWLLSRMNSTLRDFRKYFEAYELNKAVRAVRSFLVEDVSRFYMKIAKDRIAREENADAAFYALYAAALSSLKMLSVVSPFICEHLYQRFFRKFEGAESIFLLRLEDEDSAAIDAVMESQMGIVKEVCSVGLTARQAAGIKARWPIRRVYVETRSHEAIDAVNAFSSVIRTLMNAKEAVTVEAQPQGELASQAFGSGTVHLDRKIDEALYEEGVLNEVKRRIQVMRKEAGLVETDTVSLSISSEKEFEAILEKHAQRLSSEVNASGVQFAVAKEMNEYEIDGRVVKIALKKG